MALIDRAKQNIMAIVEDPAGFFVNVGQAFVGGLDNFVGGFVEHLKKGFIGWLTGAMGSLDIPDQFDLMGVFSLARQVIGLGWDFLKKTAAKIIGEENVERLEWVVEQLQTLIEGGWQALFDKIKDGLSGLKEQLFDKIREFLVVSVIKKAIVKIASMFSPVGAVVQLVLTVWDVFQTLKEQFSQIMDVVTSVVDALDLIVQGTLGPAKEKVEEVLAGVLPVAIGLLAKLIGLGGLGKKVEEFIESIRERVEKAVVKLIKKLKKKLFGKGKKGKKQPTDAADKPELGDTIKFSADGENHRLWVEVRGNDATVMVASEKMDVRERLELWKQGPIGEMRDADDKDTSAKGDEAHKVAVRAQNTLGEADKLADEVVAAFSRKQGKRNTDDLENEDDQVEELQQKLAKDLSRLFELLGTGAGALRGEFPVDPDDTHGDFRKYARGMLEQMANEAAVPGSTPALIQQTVDWATKGKYNTAVWNYALDVPLAKSHLFSKEHTHDWAAEQVEDARKTMENDQDASAEATASLADIEGIGVEAYLSKYKGSLHRAKKPFDNGAVGEIRTMAWQPGHQTKAAELVRAAFVARIEKGPGRSITPHPELEAAWSAWSKDVVAFLKALVDDEVVNKGVKGELTEQRFFTLMKGDADNRAFIGKKLRPGGKHEWIPVSHVYMLVRHAVSVKSEDSLEAALNWVDAVQALSTDTDQIVLKELSYEPGEADGVVSAVTAQSVEAPKELRRHPPQPGVLKQMVEPLHQILRDFFDETVKKNTVKTPFDFVEELEPLLKKLLWDGQLDTEKSELKKEDKGAVEVARLLGMEVKDSWTLAEFEDAAEQRVEDLVERLKAAASELG